VDVNGRPRYQTAKKNHRKFQSTKKDARTLQTDDRRQTDGRAIAYCEREREFTFAKNRRPLWAGVGEILLDTALKP